MSSPNPTCWVIDHPAHFQFFAPFIRGGHDADILVLSSRPEVQAMFRAREGRLPHRPHLWVDRPVGAGIGRFRRLILARNRVQRVRSFLRKHPLVNRVVVKGASLEIFAAKKEKRMERIYISDTESNHIAHRIALRAATSILLPESWRNRDAKQIVTDSRVKRYPGILPDFYIDTEQGISMRNQAADQLRESIGGMTSEKSAAPIVFHRRIIGGGIHDGDEVIDYQDWIRGLPVHFIHTKESAIEATDGVWDMPMQIAMFDGVLTGSTTTAAEAVIHGMPTFLISRAERGFLDELETRRPDLLFRWRSTSSDGFDGITRDWIEAMNGERRPSQIQKDSIAFFERELGPVA
ncbi:MAG: hypothetical protein CMB12_05605 [Euryarchaeota archaeon]|nr:hypothetical protein [Euryarchaeota archaeon]